MGFSLGLCMKSKKAWKLFFLTFGALFFGIYALIHAVEDRHQIRACRKEGSPSEDLQKSMRLAERFEEVQWLANSPGYSLSGSSQKVDHLAMVLRANELFLNGAYEDFLEFVYIQPKVVRLEFSEFQSLKTHINSVISDIPDLSANEVKEVIETAIVIRKAAGTETAKNKAAVYEIFADDPIEFINRVFWSHPEIFPSYNKLRVKQQELVRKITAPVSFQEIFFLEKGEQQLTKLSQIETFAKEKKMLDLALHIFTCCYAGQIGDAEKGIAPTLFTSSAYKQMKALGRALHICFEKGAGDAYEYYLASCTDQLGLDFRSPLNKALTRIAIVAEISNEEAGKILKEAFLKLPPEHLKALISWFSETNHDAEISHFAALVKASLQSNKMGSNFRERVTQTVETTLSTVADSIKQWGDLEKSSRLEKDALLNFRALVPLCQEDPEIFKEGKVTVDRKGLVQIGRQALKKEN